MDAWLLSWETLYWVSDEVVFCTWVDGKTTENNENSQTGSQVPCQKSENIERFRVRSNFSNRSKIPLVPF